MLRDKKRTMPAGAAHAKESVWASIQAGIRYLWTNKPLRFIFMILMAINFLLIGPIMVGIPVLANQRLPEGAAAFGLLMSAFAGGNLLGSLGMISSTWIDVGLLFLLGLGNGFIAVLLMTWMQTRTPREMLGRMMALL